MHPWFIIFLFWSVWWWRWMVMIPTQTIAEYIKHWPLLRCNNSKSFNWRIKGICCKWKMKRRRRWWRRLESETPIQNVSIRYLLVLPLCSQIERQRSNCSQLALHWRRNNSSVGIKWLNWFIWSWDKAEDNLLMIANSICIVGCQLNS